MTTRSSLRVVIVRLLRGVTAVTLAVAAVLVTGVSPLAVLGAGQVVAAVASPAMGRPPLLADDPAAPLSTATPRPCPAPAAPAHQAARSDHDHPTATPAPGDCGTPAPVPAVAAQGPLPAPTARPRPVVTPRTAHPATPPTAATVVLVPAAAVASPRPAAAAAPLPIPPPLWLLPAVAPVPQSYAGQLPPTSVLVLGFGSVALASAVMSLRLLRRER